MSDLKPLTNAEITELLDWVSACQSSYHIDSTPSHRFGGLGSHLQENRDSLVEYVNALIAARAQPAPITSESGNQAAQGASAITSAALHQALTDPENQPNQYGVEFLLHGPKFAFKVGAQQFTLDYEPTEPGEFEYMRDMLIHAFSTFTPDVKTEQAVPLLTVEEIQAAWVEHGLDDCAVEDFARAVEAAVRAKLGAGVPMTDPQISRLFAESWSTSSAAAFHQAVRAAEKFHGIVGKEGA